MTFPLDWSAGWAVRLMHHLWQSTIVCGSVWLLSLMLQRNAARMRFRLWMLASINFLLPFSLLRGFGESVGVNLFNQFTVRNFDLPLGGFPWNPEYCVVCFSHY